jgi:hypothetical protein
MVDILMGEIRRPNGRAASPAHLTPQAATPQAACLHRDDLIASPVLDPIIARQGVSPPRP